jgi:valyl-tRNA synthetase
MEIPKIYNPKEVEERWYQLWLDQKYFHAEIDKNKKPYTIVIPPPNVTAVLHMGHAYNNTLQDILIRYHRKRGYSALWLPGTDHAGIATQAVVERELAKANKSRYDLGRENFIEKVWEWKERHGSEIIHQLKRLGCSCDWERERFTMDEGLSRAVQEVFVKLYERELIYKGLRIVNWDPASATALADDEVDHKEVEGKLYHIQYQYKDSDDYIVVATTRPETLLGDSGVAVSPDDAEKQRLIGKEVIIPFVNRPVKIFADPHVDKDFGSGFVKATPAHDPNDFEMGLRNNLDKILMLDVDGKVLDKCKVFVDGEYIEENEIPEIFARKDRFAARKLIVEALDKMGRIVKIEKHKHSVGHSYRSKAPIEPYLSVQWFVKMKPLAEEALRVVQDGEVRFYPKGMFEKTYEHWIKNIKDWCISRQLWWGHRIPAWYNEKGEMKVCIDDPSTEKEKWTQDPDVLDTWFSSQLWPFSTLGWPAKTEELQYFYPTNTLVTAPDIIFFWVARMIMAGNEFMEEIPFKNVYFNGLIRDAQGRKMSKSLGNGIDPSLMIDQYSADAVRFTILTLSAEGQDTKISDQSFEVGRNFSNKIWNAFRFLHMNLDTVDTDYEKYEDHFTVEDRWILSRFEKTLKANAENIEKFRVGDALDCVYHFFWHDYCDWYLEMIKKRLYQPSSDKEKQTVLTVASYIMKNSMELLHPFMPFITEEIWQKFKTESEESIVISEAPKPNNLWINDEAEAVIELIQEAVSSIRNIRAEMNVPPAKPLPLLVSESENLGKVILTNQRHFNALAKIETITPVPKNFNRDEASTIVIKNLELYIPLADLIDKEKELGRLKKEIQRLEGLKKGLSAKLNNKNFVEKAPAPVVEKEKEKLNNIEENLAIVRQNYEKLK